MDNPQTPSDLVAQRVRNLRKKRGMTVADLAAACAAAGMPKLTAQTLYKLEGRPADRTPRPVSIDELLALALALNVAPVNLIVPPDDPREPYPVTATVTEQASSVRAWIRGVLSIDRDLDEAGHRDFYAEAPPGEYYYPAHMSSDGEAFVGAVQGGPPQRPEEGS